MGLRNCILLGCVTGEVINMSREINSFLKTGVFLLAAFAFALALAPGEVKAQSTFNVTVNISASSQITVIPTSLAWTQVSPGSTGTLKNVSIKNTGSLNITSLEVGANTIALESTNPLGSGDVTKYAATGLLLVQNATSGAPQYLLGRLEWNLSGALASEVFPSLQVNWSHGWYRNASKNNYLWLLQNGTNGVCNASDTSFKIKVAPENDTAMKRDLTTEITSGIACGGTTTGGGGKAWGVFNCVGATNPLNGQYVATYYDCSKIYIYNYDKTSSVLPAVTGMPYFWSSVITPGDETYMNVIAAVPLGTPAGDTTEGTVTITAA